MTRNGLVLLAAGGSAAILLGAFGLQYLGGLAPCELCLWQRWPHAAALVIGALALGLGGRALALAGAAAAATTSGLGVYHSGVERDWWPGPDSCTGGNGITGLSGADLLNFDAAPTIVMCDEVAWQMLGLSMASYNALISAALALIWLAAARSRA